MNYISLLYCFIIIFNSQTFLLAAADSDADVWKVDEGLFAGKAVSQDGTILYFGMETVNDDNAGLLDEYIENCLDRFGHILNELSKLVKKNEDDLELKSIKDFVEKNQKYIGYDFDSEEFKSLLSNLKQLNKNEIKALKLCELASSGNSFSHFSYISTKEVTQRYQFLNQNTYTLKFFLENYSDMVMFVGTEMFDTKSDKIFINRGIVKTPKYLAERKYKGVSIALHGFTSAVGGRFFKKQYLQVSPIASMHNILVSQLNQEDYYSPEVESGIIKKDHDACDSWFIIDKKALLSHFYGSEEKIPFDLRVRRKEEPDYLKKIFQSLYLPFL